MQTHITCLLRARHADFPFAYTHELFFTKHLSNNKNNCKALNSYGTTRKEQKKNTKIKQSNQNDDTTCRKAFNEGESS